MKSILTLLLLVFSFPVSADALKPISIQSRDKTVHELKVEVAADPATRARGLMLRGYLPEQQGMIFTFERSDIIYFWMKNTLIPLDMVFIDSSGIIRKIHENAQPNDLTQISSDVPVKYALEINGGLSRKLGIGPGDKVAIDALKTVAKP